MEAIFQLRLVCVPQSECPTAHTLNSPEDGSEVDFELGDTYSTRFQDYLGNLFS